MTFAQAAKVWESDFLSKMRPSSQNSARYILKKHLLPRFGEMSLDDINAKVVRAWITDLDNADELAPKSISNVWKVLKLILEQEERVTRTWKLNLPEIPYKEQRWFTQDEIRRIVEAAKGQYKILYYLLGVSGLRAGEAFALHVEDIWFDRGLIHCTRSTFKHIEGPVKTKAGFRDVPLDPASDPTVERLSQRADDGPGLSDFTWHAVGQRHGERRATSTAIEAAQNPAWDTA